jgi:hypothetical protein
MIGKITVILSLLIMTGCGLGRVLEAAGREKERYRTCVLHQIEAYAAQGSDPNPGVETTTEFVVSACRHQEEAYVAAMTDLAMTITGHLASREKFRADEEATLRGDLRDLAAGLVEQER